MDPDLSLSPPSLLPYLQPSDLEGDQLSLDDDHSAVLHPSQMGPTSILSSGSSQITSSSGGKSATSGISKTGRGGRGNIRRFSVEAPNELSTINTGTHTTSSGDSSQKEERKDDVFAPRGLELDNKMAVGIKSSGRGGSGNIGGMRKALRTAGVPDNGPSADSETMEEMLRKEREVLAAHRAKKLAAKAGNNRTHGRGGLGNLSLKTKTKAAKGKANYRISFGKSSSSVVGGTGSNELTRVRSSGSLRRKSDDSARRVKKEKGKSKGKAAIPLPNLSTPNLRGYVGGHPGELESIHMQDLRGRRIGRTPELEIDPFRFNELKIDTNTANIASTSSKQQHYRHHHQHPQHQQQQHYSPSTSSSPVTPRSASLPPPQFPAPDGPLPRTPPLPPSFLDTLTEFPDPPPPQRPQRHPRRREPPIVRPPTPPRNSKRFSSINTDATSFIQPSAPPAVSSPLRKALEESDYDDFSTSTTLFTGSNSPHLPFENQKPLLNIPSPTYILPNTGLLHRQPRGEWKLITKVREERRGIHRVLIEEQGWEWFGSK